MTLFGISEKKKRGIVVPVMALAVCAVAMVGLGFALETSVTSDSNDVRILMVDLAKTESDLGVSAPDSNKSANSALDYDIKTVKLGTVDGDGDLLTFEVTGGQSFLRIYGNLTGVTLKASVTGGTNIQEVGLTLYEVNITESGSNPRTVEIGNKVGDVTAGSSLTPFKSGVNNCSLSCGTYYVKITSIAGFNYTGTGYNDGTWSGTGSELITPGDSLSFTFEASVSDSS